MQIRVLRFFFLLSIMSSLAWAERLLSSFEEIAAFMEGNKGATLEDVLSKLHPTLKKTKHFVFNSRQHLIEASLEKPRIILGSADGKTMISFGFDETVIGGNRLEIIERDPVTQENRFRSVEFAKGSEPTRVQREPSTCVSCHGTPENPVVGMRPIWDSYPEWAGVYGLAHNGLTFGTSRFGVSHVPTAKFEREGWAKIQAQAKTHSRLRYLGIEGATLEDLADMNSDLTDRMSILNFERIVAIAERHLDSLPIDEQKHRLAKMKAFAATSGKEVIPNPVSEDYRPESQERYIAAIEAEMADKWRRLKLPWAAYGKGELLDPRAFQPVELESYSIYYSLRMRYLVEEILGFDSKGLQPTFRSTYLARFTPGDDENGESLLHDPVFLTPLIRRLEAKIGPVPLCDFNLESGRKLQ